MSYGKYEGPEVYGEELLAIVDLINEALKNGRARNFKILKSFVDSEVVQDEIKDQLRIRKWHKDRGKKYNMVEYKP